MAFILQMAAMAQYIENTKSDEDLYLPLATDLKIKSIKKVDNVVIIKTNSTIKNSGILFDNWIELHFTIEYDLTHEKAQEILSDLGYDEYSTKNISIVDFLAIKVTGRKIYKFFELEAMSNIKAVKRILDLKEYDDVKKIRNVYWRYVLKYKNKLGDIKMDQYFIESDKDEYLRKKKELKKYNELLHELLEQFDSDSGDSGDSGGGSDSDGDSDSGGDSDTI